MVAGIGHSAAGPDSTSRVARGNGCRERRCLAAWETTLLPSPIPFRVVGNPDADPCRELGVFLSAEPFPHVPSVPQGGQGPPGAAPLARLRVALARRSYPAIGPLPRRPVLQAHDFVVWEVGSPVTDPRPFHDAPEADAGEEDVAVLVAVEGEAERLLGHHADSRERRVARYASSASATQSRTVASSASAASFTARCSRRGMRVAICTMVGSGLAGGMVALHAIAGLREELAEVRASHDD